MARASKRDIGKRVKGRVCAYNNQLGYGYILTEDGTDLFISSYILGKNEKKIVVGSVVECNIGEYNNKVVATDIKIIDKYKDQITDIVLPSGKSLPIRAIHKFGKNNALKRIVSNGKITEQDILDHGYQISDLDYLYIETTRQSYTFFKTGSPLKGDGQIDIDKYYNELHSILLKM